MKISPRGEIEKEKRTCKNSKNAGYNELLWPMCVLDCAIDCAIHLSEVDCCVVLCICLKMRAMEHICRGAWERTGNQGEKNKTRFTHKRERTHHV